ncbi:EAL domain-containing protein [Erythrobacter sp. sf7]|uniref:EAL domain-containing protein n=1 Tax=Erythrobacter fulvus TaxID=2987523 RepID=A0ABT5JQR5_9SPHN|nr:EAL domain-containing protein [Erythrobacter fulvus]MDC8754740.1 EAL domain-containing protein [Erythrobacter fulvus]
MRSLRTRLGFRANVAGEGTACDVERAHRLISYSEKFEARWFWETDADGRLTYLSEAVSDQIETFGINPIGTPIEKIFRLDEVDAQHLRSLKFHIVSRTSFSEYPIRAKKGLHESWWSISGRPWFDLDGNYQGFVGSGTDLTKARKQEATIRRLAVTDSLTGLANRQRMQDHLEALLRSEGRNSSDCSLMIIDLDGFKGVNDTLGHPVGDALLIRVAERLSSVVGESGVVGRLGGDEFQILLPGHRTEKGLSDLACQTIKIISEPYLINGSTVNINCSIGIASSDIHSNPDNIVRNADLALYSAKKEGRGKFFFFDEKMLLTAKWRKRLEDDLRNAVNKDQLKLMFQPIVEANSETIKGFEALLRWDHPQEGSISPSEFIPIAEESGLIQQIGDWVIRTAVDVIRSLPSDLRVAVNVSPIQFSNPALLTTVANAISFAQIDPSRLELELTESVFLEDSAKLQKIFKSLKALGVRLALDDFGTGYSSLSYLKEAPFDKIKIDQSFVKGAVDPRSRNSAIIAAIVSLSNALGMETTAEGLEHQDEIRLIKRLGCTQIQGFVYGGALDIDELLPELQAGVRRMRPIGPRRSRRPRTTFIKPASMNINEGQASVLIRNISENGALLEYNHFSEGMVGVNIRLDFVGIDGTLATIRWVAQGQAGVEFHETIALNSIF